MKLKVLQLLPALNHGGVERGTLDLSNFLIREGHESVVVSSGGIFAEEITNSGGSHYAIPIAEKKISTLLQYKELARIYKHELPHIIHIRSRFPAWVHFLAIRSLKEADFLPRVVSTFHGLYSKPWYSKSMTYVDKTIAISQIVHKYILDNYKINAENIKLIYRGCDTSIFNNSPFDNSWVENFYKKFPEVKDKKIILFPSRVTAWKGIESFGKALSLLSGSDWIGVVAGPIATNKQNYYLKLQTLFADLIASKKLLFIGTQSAIENLYKISCITLNLSQKPEPFGRTIIEAAACGCKVIGWNRGGVGESINQIDPSGLVEFNDFKSLVNSIRTALNYSNHKSILPEQFTLDYQCRETLALYLDILKSNE
ncbi:MAG: glycosyltransferase [Gammaproteobacteria bacterium]